MSFRASTLVVAALGGGIAIALACLPDLDIAPASPGCGNGVVDLELGEECDPGDAGGACTTDCTHVLCDGGFVDPQSNHCYFWTTSATVQPTGQTSCQLAGGHLVTFASFDELVFVTGRAGKAAGAPTGSFLAWGSLVRTGVNDAGSSTFNQTDEPGWSHDCPGGYAHVEAGAVEFPPLRDGGAESECVMWSKLTSAPWYTTSCDIGFAADGGLNKRPVLCERQPVGSFTHTLDPLHPECGKDPCVVVRYTLSQKTYALVLTPSTADGAQAACQQRGGRLLVLGTSEEREQVVGEVARAVREVWIGLSTDGDAGWMWDNGQPLGSYAPWGDLEPKSTGPARAFVRINNAAYDTRLAHADDDAGALRSFVCEFSAVPEAGTD